MKQYLLKCSLIIIILSSCVSTANQNNQENRNSISGRTLPPVSSSFKDVDTTLIIQPQLPAGVSPASLIDQPRTEEGAFVITPGLYETDFKTYCLQPGTPGPSAKDLYFQADLKGSRKDIIQTILLNSRKESHLDQENVQLLLWSVVSHSDFNKLSPDVQYTATKLLSPKQIFELQGGVVGVVKKLAAVVPSTGGQNDIRQLFDLSVRSYEAYERIAVINTPSKLRQSGMTQDHWYKHEEGYFVRYIANSYKETRIQVYVPAGVSNSSDTTTNNYIVFDPASWVVVPANSNAQRLGIGGPVSDIIKSVIKGISIPKKTEKPKQPSTPKPVGKTV